MASQPAPLVGLPADLLLVILDHLDTARDLAHLADTCWALHQFMQRSGWRAFTKRAFPGAFAHALTAGIDEGDGDDDDNDEVPRWTALADSLTWQSRAMDRRALGAQALLGRLHHVPRSKRQRPFAPSLAVHFQPARSGAGGGAAARRRGAGVDGEEMLVVGAGEDVVARFRERRRPGRDGSAPAPAPRWRVHEGKTDAFRPGRDDVRAVAVVADAMGQPGRRGILAARDSGHLALLSAEPDARFGSTLARFAPADVVGEAEGSAPPIDQSRLYSIDVLSHGGSASRGAGIAAVTTPSDIVFYPLPADAAAADAAAVVRPLASFPMGDAGLYHTGTRQPYNARWMPADGVLAVGLGQGPRPLRYLATTPTGPMELTAAYGLPDLVAHYGLSETTLMVPSALEPIPPSAATGGNGCLVLSGWRDGTCRLQDLRSASPFDLIYQDAVMGSVDFPLALLVGGAGGIGGGHHFVVGNHASAGLKIFDLRWPRRYLYTEAMPCSSALPFPTPPVPMGGVGAMRFPDLGQPPPATGCGAMEPMLPRLVPPAQRTASNWPPRPAERPNHLPAVDRCRALDAVRCRWHTGAQDLFYRGSSTSIYLQHTLQDRGFEASAVYALASAADSDLAPANFYVGLANCVVETFLHEEAVPLPPPAASSPDAASTQPAEAWVEGGGAPHFGYPPVVFPKAEEREEDGTQEADPDDGHFRTVDLTLSMMDNGDSMARVNAEMRSMWLPRIRAHNLDYTGTPLRRRDKVLSRRFPHGVGNGASGTGDTIPQMHRQRHRLDYGYQVMEDFGQGLHGAA